GPRSGCSSRSRLAAQSRLAFGACKSGRTCRLRGRLRRRPAGGDQPHELLRQWRREGKLRTADMQDRLGTHEWQRAKVAAARDPRGGTALHASPHTELVGVDSSPPCSTSPVSDWAASARVFTSATATSPHPNRSTSRYRASTPCFPFKPFTTWTTG